MSGGTEGALSPHFVVFEARDVAAPPEAGALAVGRARTAPLPFEGSRPPRGRSTTSPRACAPRWRMPASAPRPTSISCRSSARCSRPTGSPRSRRAGLTDRDPRHAEVDGSVARRFRARQSRSRSARSTARASRDESIGRDWSLFSSRASTSAGVELVDHEIVVLGAADHWTGPLRIDHAVMRDAIDVDPVRGGACAARASKAPGQLRAGRAGAARRAARQGRGELERGSPRLPPHDAQRFRHLLDPPRARLRRGRARGPHRPHRNLRLRRRRASGAGRRRPGRDHCDAAGRVEPRSIAA